MKRFFAERHRDVVLASGATLLLLTFLFPYATFNYSAGTPRGPVVMELSRTEHEWATECIAGSLGWEVYYSGAGFVPSWNAHLPEVQWPVVGLQAMFICAMCGSALVLGRPLRLDASKELPDEPAADISAGL